MKKKVKEIIEIKEEKKKNKKLIIIIILCFVIVALTIFIGIFCNQLVFKTNLKEQAKLSAQKYIESTNLQFDGSVSIPLNLLKDNEFLGYFDSKCLDASYVVVKRNSNNELEYEPVIICDSSKAVLKLNGDATQTVEVGEKYIEQGANLDGSLVNEVSITNNVNTSKKGTYSVLYSVEGSDIPPVLRVIEVVDTTKPILTLKNSDIIYLLIGEEYQEFGYKAIDNYDGDITKNVVVSGIIDTTKAGTYYITYTVKDGSNNETIIKRQIIVRENTPTVSLKGYATVYVDVFGKYIEDGYTAYDKQGNNLTKNVIVEGNVNTNVVGEYVITYKVTGSNGSVAIARRVVKVVDTIKPEIKLNGSNEVTIKWGIDKYTELGAIASDNYDGDITINIKTTGIFNPNKVGTYYLAYTVTDSNGNRNSVQRIIKVVDEDAPVVMLIGDATVYIEAGIKYEDKGVNVVDNYDKNVVVEVKGNVNTNILGNYTITYIAKDSSGNITTVTRTIIVRDTTAPVITLIGNTAIDLELGTAYVELGYTASDNFDKYVNNNVIVTNNVNHNLEGTYYVKYNVTDTNGNVAKEVVRTVIVKDTTAPSITINTDDLFLIGNYVQKVSVKVTVNDLFNTVKSVRYAWTNGSRPTKWLEYNNYIQNTEITLEQLLDGTYHLFIEATDASGNVSVSEVGPFKIDTTAPSVSFVPNGSTGSTITTIPTITDSFSGVNKIYYSWSNDNTNTPTDFVEYTTQDLTQNVDGTYYLWIKAIDKAGNEIIEVSNKFIVDNAYPEISFAYPSNNPIVKEAIVNVTASGNSGKVITKVEYIWTKSAVQPTEEYTTWEDYESNHTITMPNNLDGTYYLWIKATDSLGLISYNGSRMITLDNTNPTINIAPNGSTTPIKDIEIDIVIEEVNIDRILWAISTEFDINKVTLSNSIDELISKIKAEKLDGTYYLHIIATDKAGNYSEFTSSSFEFDNTAPENPEITFDENWTNQDVKVTITGTDNLEYSFDNETWLKYDENTELIIEQNTKIYAKSSDKAGNVSEVVSKDITNIDKTNPIIKLDYKTDLTNKIVVNYVLEDTISGIDKIFYAWTTDLQEPTFNLELSELADEIIKNDINGTYYLWIRVIDKAGNEIVARTESIQLDKDAPTVEIVDNGTKIPVTSKDSTINITDDSELDIKYIFTNNTDKPALDEAWTSWYDYSVDNNVLTLDDTYTDGIYYLHILVTDLAGNETYVISNSYTLVNSKPIVIYDPATNLDYSLIINSTVSASINNATISNLYYSWNVSGNVSDVNDWIEFNNGETISKNDVTGAYYLYIKVVDNVDGNRETIIKSTGTFNLDKDNVIVSFSPNGTSKPVKEAETEIIATDNHSGIEFVKYAWGNSNVISPDVSEFIPYELGTSIKKTTTNSYETLYLWVVTKDLAGNENYTVSNAYEIDNSYPTIELDPNRSNPVNDITVKVTITVDNNKTLSNIYYAWTNESETSESTVWSNWDLVDYANDNTLYQTGLNGNYYLHIKVIDNNGLEAIKSTFALEFDNQAPVITITPNNSLTPVTEITPVIAVLENNDYDVFYSLTLEANHNLATYLLWADFMGQGEDRITLGGKEFNGTYYLHVKVVDEAGNITYSTATYEFDNIAPEKPEISFDESWTNKDVVLTITGTDTLQYSNDNKNWLTYDASNKPQIATNGMVYTRSVDIAGNISEVSSKEVTNIDKTLPQVELSFNTTEWTNKDVVVSLNIDNLSPIEMIRWSHIELTADDYKNGRGYVVNLNTKEFAQGINRSYIQIYVLDEAGNVTLITTSVTNIDKQAPEIIVNPGEVTINEKTTYDIFQGISIKDNVGFGENKITSTEFSSEPPGEYTITYTISDLAGNTTTATRKITVLDITAPGITLNGEANIEVEVGNTYNELGATANDSFDGDITSNITVTGSVNTDVVGTYTITYTVSDNAGNTTEITRTITVVDKIKPEITLNGEANIEIEVGNIYNELGANATDNYDGDITSNIIVTGTVNTNVVGTYTITYTVSDDAGNTTEITRTITVVDKIKPEITLNGEANIEIELGNTYTELGANATDNYDGDITSNIVVTGTVNTNVVGTYIITYTVKDSSNNESTTLTRTVKVVYKIKPEITLNGEANIEIEVGNTYTELGATAIDNYDGDITSNIIVTGTVNTNVVGTYTITYTVKDSSNNESITLTRTVKIVDTTKPVIKLNGGNTRLEVGNIYNELGATATDNYDGNITSNIIIIGTVNTNVVGIYTITYTVSDNVGNTTAITRTVEIYDEEAPVIELKGDREVNITLGNKYIEQGYTVIDNYDTNLEVIVTDNIDYKEAGTYTISYNVTDSNGNKATTVTRTINVLPNTLDELFREDNNCEANSDCYSLSNNNTNYVWFGGYLFRVYKSNYDGTTKLITEGSISSLSYDDDSSVFTGSVIENWLNDTFYNSLSKKEYIANANWCNLNTSNADNNRTTCTSDTIVTSKVGLLTLFEYNLLGGKNSYLNNNDYFFTMTKYGAKSVWAIDANGNQVSGEMVYNVDAIRPVITLKDGIKAVSGNGTENNPYRLENDNSANTNDKLNNRYSGEYVSLNNKLWRVVTTDNNGTKLILDGYLEDANGIIEAPFGSNNIYGNSNVLSIMNSNLPANNLLNTVWYKGAYAFGQNPIGTSIKNSGDYSNHQFGLIRIGELMSGKGATLNMDGNTYWTLTTTSDGKVWHISTTGGAATDKLEAPRAIRPVIKISNTNTIKTGEGTYTNPYVLN